jgi:hypothetical protein
MLKEFGIYVDSEIVYKGNFSEVPSLYRENLISSLEQWADILGNKSLNELLYSSFYWYYNKTLYCSSCKEFFDDEVKCLDCNLELANKYFYDRNANIDKIMDCIGMITRVTVIE